MRILYSSVSLSSRPSRSTKTNHTFEFDSFFFLRSLLTGVGFSLLLADNDDSQLDMMMLMFANGRFISVPCRVFVTEYKILYPNVRFLVLLVDAGGWVSE